MTTDPTLLARIIELEAIIAEVHAAADWKRWCMEARGEDEDCYR
jgi:hypothetical protein